MPEKLRISGGTRRGRRLESPPADSIRPASDLVRQAVFNMIYNELPGCVFHDVYAGTGIVGIEALSRGAKRAVFIERNGKQVALIRRNLSRLEFGPEQTSVRGGDALVWSNHFVPDPDYLNIVFLGAPYPDFAENLERMMELVATVQGRLGPNDILVLQFPRLVDPEVLPRQDGWYRQRHYGKTRVGIWCAAAETEDRDESDDAVDNESPNAEDDASNEVQDNE